MGLFSKKEIPQNWKDEVRRLAEDGKIMSSTIPLTERVCYTCQHTLGVGIHERLIIRANTEVYEIYFHGTESCYDFEKIKKNLNSKGQEILYKGQETNLKTDDDNLKAFLRDALYDKNKDDKNA